MKKTKLLMPILGAATIAGAITPIAVSCGNSKKLEIDVTSKKIITTDSGSAPFEFVWNSFNAKSKRKLTFTNMTGHIGLNEGREIEFSEIDINPTQRDQIAGSLSDPDGDGTWKGNLSFKGLALEIKKEYVAKFHIDYRVGGKDKKVDINNVIVTYKGA